MALDDWERTRDTIILYCREKSRTEDWLLENCKRPDESEDDFFSLLQDMKSDKIVNNHYGRVHLITAESEARRKNNTDRKTRKSFKSNPWAWYAWMQGSEEFRQQLRNRFSKEDGRVFQALAKIILLERPPALGERVSGPITEEEGRYITKINQQLEAYLRERDG